MIFKEFSKFRNFTGTDLAQRVAYIEQFLDRIQNKSMDDLSVGLRLLKFTDNFSCQRILVPGVNLTAKVEVKHSLNAKIDSFLVLNGVAGVILDPVEKSSGGIYNDRFTLILDNNVYNSGLPAGYSKSVDILVFK